MSQLFAFAGLLEPQDGQRRFCLDGGLTSLVSLA
jgi:hypothetical protein